jgi:hypothetical protein
MPNGDWSPGKRRFGLGAFLGWAPVVIAWLSLTGCLPKAVRVQDVQKNYVLGEVQRVNVGAPIIVLEQTDLLKERRPTGCIPTPFPQAWENVVVRDGSFRQTLIYGGRSGSIITVSYREYMTDLARPAYYQDVQYDLTLSDTIVFRHFRLRVVDASNESIEYVVLAD